MVGRWKGGSGKRDIGVWVEGGRGGKDVGRDERAISPGEDVGEAPGADEGFVGCAGHAFGWGMERVEWDVVVGGGCCGGNTFADGEV